jgi:hypothetical protein
MPSPSCSTHLQSRRSRYVFWGFVAVAAFYLLAEHRAHVLYFLPYLLVLACPLMHLFHHGHRHGESASHSAEHASNSSGEKPQ